MRTGMEILLEAGVVRKKDVPFERRVIVVGVAIHYHYLYPN